MAQTILYRKTLPYYNFLPYHNRSDGSESWQWEFLRHAHMKGRCALGGNRIGKTEIGAYDSVMIVTGDHPWHKCPKNGVLWVVGLDNTMMATVDRPMIDRYLPPWYKTHWNGQKQIWTCQYEDRYWEIHFKSSEMGQAKFQGKKVDHVWMDEEIKKTDIWPEIKTRLVDNRGTWSITATPVKGTAWLKSISEKPTYTTYGGMKENPYIPMEEIEELALTLTADEIDVRINGKYMTFGGNPVFPGSEIRKMLDRVKADKNYPEIGTITMEAA